MTNTLLNLENIRSGAVPSDAHAVGFLLGEIARLDTDAAGERAERESWKHGFKNFHRLLCERFGYVHDDKDWLRDQLSLMEHIANKVTPEPLSPHCKTCECPTYVEPPEAYPLDFALNLARLWRVGKMIGGDEDAVIQSLLTEVERLQKKSGAEPTLTLSEAEILLQAWADPLPPNGNLYWEHVNKAREYFKGRQVKSPCTHAESHVHYDADGNGYVCCNHCHTPL